MHRLLLPVVYVGVHLALAPLAAIGASSPQAANSNDELDRAIESVMKSKDAGTYRRSVEVINSYAQAGNLKALRASALIWQFELDNPAHQLSKTNAYFSFLAVQKVSPSDDSFLADPFFGDAAASFEEVEKSAGLLAASYGRDVITDQPFCELATLPQKGVSFGFNRDGVYVAGEAALDVGSFKKFALRVDDGTSYFGLEPDAWRSSKKVIDAAARLRVRGLATSDEVQRVLAENRENLAKVRRIYVVRFGTAQMETLIRQMALGRVAHARIVLNDGTTRTETFPLQVIVDDSQKHELGPMTGSPLPIFDLLLYRFVWCAYGAIT